MRRATNHSSLLMVVFHLLLVTALPASTDAFVLTNKQSTKVAIPSQPQRRRQRLVQPSVLLKKKEGYYPDVASFTTRASSSSALAAAGTEWLSEGSMSQSLLKLLLETMIVNGVPALFTIIVIGFAAFQFRPRKGGDGEEEDDDDVFIFGGGKSKKDYNAAAELYSDLYEGDENDGMKNRKSMSPFRFLKSLRQQTTTTPAQINRGIPPLQYITITNLNQKYDSFDYSFMAATQSKAKAAATYRAKNFDRALRIGLNAGAADTTTATTSSDPLLLSPFAKTTLLELEKDFLQDGSKLLHQIQSAQAELTKTAIDEEMEAMGVDVYELDPAVPNVTATKETETAIEVRAEEKKREKEQQSKNKKSKSSSSSHKKSSSSTSEEAIFSKLQKAQKDLIKVELNFVKDVVATLGSERATGIRTALLGDINARGTGGLLTQLQERPLSVMLQGLSTPPHHHHHQDDVTNSNSTTGDAAATNNRVRKSLFVTRFPGDVQASQVAELREEVTAIVRNAQPGDEALVILQTGGGTVTGYGLAAAQLLRFKDAGMKLTIAVEQVAASGGYMMCCVADRIISSPFAVLGSIGVISDIPNVYDRLKKEGIEFQTVTAGKYKRTITPTKKVTKEDFDKSKEDVEQILVLFKQFVHQNRPSLDIEKVATGETWFGEDALERGLTDEIKTADEILIEYVDNGWDVYEVEYTPPDDMKKPALPGFGGSISGQGGIGNVFRWMVRTLVKEVKAELGSDINLKQEVPMEERYMMLADKADRVRAEHK